MLINQLALLFFNMKNFAFRTRLSSFQRKTFILCYAVVNLLLPTLQSGFGSFEPFLSDGGLKWTRTIDLTLIRRVL